MLKNPAEGLPSLRGDEHILLGRESPLRRIPANVHSKQAFFLDGIRHSIEIMDVSFSRLRDELTRLALSVPKTEELASINAIVFLDAWAFVDAVDRFQQLYLNFPGLRPRDASNEAPPLREVLHVFRKLRNVADHLVTTSDQVLATGGSALGELTWLTGAKTSPEVIAWHCVLRPGTFRSAQELPTANIRTTLDWPTDYICLSAGKFQGNISVVRRHIAARVRHLETQLSEVFARPENSKITVINDFFGKRPVRLLESTHTAEQPDDLTS